MEKIQFSFLVKLGDHIQTKMYMLPTIIKIKNTMIVIYIHTFQMENMRMSILVVYRRFIIAPRTQAIYSKKQKSLI